MLGDVPSTSNVNLLVTGVFVTNPGNPDGDIAFEGNTTVKGTNPGKPKAPKEPKGPKF